MYAQINVLEILLTNLSEIFGTSEDQAAFDHSTDADNGRLAVAPTSITY